MIFSFLKLYFCVFYFYIWFNGCKGCWLFRFKELNRFMYKRFNFLGGRFSEVYLEFKVYFMSIFYEYFECSFYYD